MTNIAKNMTVGILKIRIYESELNAIKSFIPSGLYGVEIGIGTGRFAVPLGVRVGIEPANNMAEIARSHGINVLDGIAENLPLDSGEFDFVLMVTVICFLICLQELVTFH